MSNIGESDNILVFNSVLNKNQLIEREYVENP